MELFLLTRDWQLHGNIHTDVCGSRQRVFRILWRRYDEVEGGRGDENEDRKGICAAVACREGGFCENEPP